MFRKEETLQYVSPRIETIELEQSDILCNSNELLEDGGNIFGNN